MPLNRRQFLQTPALGAGAAAAAAGCAGAPEERAAASNPPAVAPAIAALQPMTAGIVPISADERNARIAKAQRLMAEQKIDAIFMEGTASCFYFAAMRWGQSERTFGLVIPARGELAYVCPKFEEERAFELIKFGRDVRTWEEELPRELERARRMGTGLCLAMIDLDNFKDYNDRHGHQAGDLVLKEAASAWRTEVRSTDLLARYGGEEFVLLPPACALDDAVQIVERLRLVTPLVTCSVGLARWDFQEASSQLVERADQALYAAKTEGRNRLVLA